MSAGNKKRKHCSNEIKEQKAEANKLPCHPENSEINFNIKPLLDLSMWKHESF